MSKVSGVSVVSVESKKESKVSAPPGVSLTIATLVIFFCAYEILYQTKKKAWIWVAAAGLMMIANIIIAAIAMINLING